MSNNFISVDPSLEDYWRGIILFGLNVASYKFALASALLELQPQAGQLVTLDDLAGVYVKHITEHLKKSDKQGTSKSSKFLDACRQFNANKITHDALLDTTVRYGFVNVIDAFHVIGGQETPKRFFMDERNARKGILITDDFSQLLHQEQSLNLPREVESRWQLVERSWELGVSRSLLSIEYDHESEFLFSLSKSQQRKPVTGSREALNGYQKGQCFYCYSDIRIDQKGSLFPDVDHFFPHTLKSRGFSSIVDGVWNLVLSCQDCNGAKEKGAKIPCIDLLERLHTRNEFLIGSNHPLKQTLIQQTGNSLTKRKFFLNSFFNDSIKTGLPEWARPEERAAPKF